MPNGDYLTALQAFLRDKVKKGEMTREEANTIGQRATELMNTGYFGASLPYYGEIYREERPEESAWSIFPWQTPTGEGFQAPWTERAPWRREPGAGLPGFMQHYMAAGLTPSQALALEKYMQPPEEEVVEPAWKVGYRGKEYTPEQWGMVGAPLWQREYAQAITPYQQWQMEQGRLQIEAENVQRQQEYELKLAQYRGMSDYAREQQRMGARMYGQQLRQAERVGGKPEGEAREQAQLSWERGRQALISELDPNRQWIEIFRLQQRRNPYATEEGMVMPPVKARPTVPETPGWLGEMYPALGERISKIPVAPLAGQQWAGMPESQRQQWFGFTEWAGADPMDLLSQMQMMAPRRPQVPRRWTPARQWA